MYLATDDITALILTIRLASTVTIILILVGAPLSWWLARTRSFLKAPISALIALPLVLPPTVLGFYLLIAMGPEGPIGKITQIIKNLRILIRALLGLVGTMHPTPRFFNKMKNVVAATAAIKRVDLFVQ